jgi:hypothetical protein
MKTITRKYKVFTFAELSEEAKKKALDNYRCWNIEFNWWDATIEDFIEKMKEIGYGIRKEDVEFSGFSSQGDGASFEAEIDLKTWFKNASAESNKKYKNIKEDEEARFNIIRNSHQCSHEYTMGVDWEADIANGKEELIEEFGELLLQEAREYARDLYRKLEKEYDYLTSDECIIESLEANKITFLENGNTFTA